MFQTPPRRTTQRQTRSKVHNRRTKSFNNAFTIWPFILITPGVLIFAFEWTHAWCTSIGLCAAQDPARLEELSTLAVLLTRQVVHAQTILVAVMALGNPAGFGLDMSMKDDLEKENPRNKVTERLQPFFDSTYELSKGLKPLNNVAKFDIIKAVRRISRAADLDLPHLAAASLWPYNRAQTTTAILSESLTLLSQPFNDISTLLTIIIPIAAQATTRVQDAKRDISKQRFKEGGPESLRVAFQSVPIIYDNLRLIQDYLVWYDTLSHDTFAQPSSLDLDTALSDLRLVVTAFRDEWDKTMKARFGQESPFNVLPYPAKVMKEVPLSLIGNVVRVVVPRHAGR